MEQICCILDLDGFSTKVSDNFGVTYKSEFFLRELGCVKIRGNQKFLPCSYRFDLRGHLNLQNCTVTDEKTVQHQATRILGLPIFAAPKERPVDYDERFEVLNFIYKSYSDKNSVVVAYKGGHREKDMLSKLDIPCVNLEQFGCPKFETLLKTYKNESGRPTDCGFHTLASKRMLVHCAEAEVCAYRDWFIKNVQEFAFDGACGPSVEPSHHSSSASFSWDQYSSSSSD